MRALRLVIILLALGAAAPVAAQTAYPEVMTLEQAAKFLAVKRAYFGQLAGWGQVPGRQIGSQWRFSCKALLNWLAGSYTKPQPQSPALLYGCGSTVVRAAASANAATGPGTVSSTSTGATPIGEAPDQETADDVFLRDQRLLLGSGDVTLELGLFYACSDDQAFVSSGGSVALGLVERDSLISSLTVRYGLFPDTELFASSSLRRSSSQTFAGANETASTTDTRLGGITLGVRETVLHEALGVPDVMLTFRGGLPTGDNSFSLGGGVALIKSYDPVVLFANANYDHTFARRFSDVTLLEPENQLTVTLGFAFALNDTLTLSTLVSGRFTDETVFANATLYQRALIRTH